MFIVWQLKGFRGKGLFNECRDELAGLIRFDDNDGFGLWVNDLVGVGGVNYSKINRYYEAVHDLFAVLEFKLLSNSVRRVDKFGIFQSPSDGPQAACVNRNQIRSRLN